MYFIKVYIYPTSLLFCRTLLDVLDLHPSTIQHCKFRSVQQKCALLDVLDVLQHKF
nr:MAG TPA: hypothetical protein [Caudoviricetes sp.]